MRVAPMGGQSALFFIDVMDLLVAIARRELNAGH
jgi:hypothetical protein